MPPEADAYCPRCAHKMDTYGKKMLCTARATAVPVEAARHAKGACGPDAHLFDAYDQQEELDWND